MTETVTEEDVEAFATALEGGAGMTINPTGWRPDRPDEAAAERCADLSPAIAR